MKGQIIGGQGDQTANGAGHGVGDVMQLHIEEDRHAEPGDFCNAFRPLGTEKFEAKFEAIHRAANGLSQAAHFIEIGAV